MSNNLNVRAAMAFCDRQEKFISVNTRVVVAAPGYTFVHLHYHKACIATWDIENRQLRTSLLGMNSSTVMKRLNVLLDTAWHRGLLIEKPGAYSKASEEKCAYGEKLISPMSEQIHPVVSDLRAILSGCSSVPASWRAPVGQDQTSPDQETPPTLPSPLVPVPHYPDTASVYVHTNLFLASKLFETFTDCSDCPVTTCPYRNNPEMFGTECRAVLYSWAGERVRERLFKMALRKVTLWGNQ